MKELADLLKDVERRVEGAWADVLLAGPVAGNWRQKFSLGGPKGAAALDGSENVVEWAQTWRSWVEPYADRGVGLELDRCAYLTTRQDLPTHVVVATLDAAAELIGNGWTKNLKIARERLASLSDSCPGVEIDPATLRAVMTSYTDTDFELLLSSVAWFVQHPASELTLRQVPILGLHSKWLKSAGRRKLICRLAGLESLGLKKRRPHPVNFTYLDRDYRRGEGRIHDSIVPGDRGTPAYQPTLVLICENRDSAVFFPDVPAAIAVQGAGGEGPARFEELRA